MGNMKSVCNALEFLGAQPVVVEKPVDLSGDKVIIPGVGAFGEGMHNLRPFVPEIEECLSSGTPLLGICLGLQVLFEGSEESPAERGLGILKGKVVKVLPGMQAAFVDIGLEKAAFLYVSDVYGGMEDYEEMGFLGMEVPASFNPSSQIEDLISEGQEILVQVSKEPLGTKGTRITSHTTLPGRYLVYMPLVDHIGVSRRIKDDKERRRLREIVQSMKPPVGGFIVRTASEGAEADEIRTDMEFLLHLWNNIQKKRENSTAPSLIYSDLTMVLRVIRDILSPRLTGLSLTPRRSTRASSPSSTKTLPVAVYHNPVLIRVTFRSC
jgi:hypothetical protein